MRWWDALSIPPLSEHIDYHMQMRQRQTYFVSRTLGLVTLADLLSMLLKLIDPGPLHVILIPIGGLLINIAATVCNRLGLTLLAGTCVMAETIGAVIAIILLHLPLYESDLPLFCLFGISEVLAGLLLPSKMIVVVTTLDCLLIVGLLSFLPLTAPLRQDLAQAPAGLFFPLLALIVIVGVGISVLVTCLSKEVYRASYAEKAARLQAQLAADRQRLTDGIQQIAEILTEVSKGHLEARVALDHGNILWEVAIPLNNLLNQAMSWKQELQQLERILTHSLEEGNVDETRLISALSSNSIADLLQAFLQQQKAIRADTSQGNDLPPGKLK